MYIILLHWILLETRLIDVATLKYPLYYVA